MDTSSLRALSISDHVFLMLEKRNQPMHVAGICVFELPDDADFLNHFIDDIKSNTVPPTAPFNQILTHKLFWQTDKNFNPNNHFYHIKLSSADNDTFMAYISAQHSRMMDRQKPLWEFHLIEGLAPKAVGRPMQFAIYLKVHHAMADGIAAMRLLQLYLSKDPNAHLTAPFWTIKTDNRQHSKNKRQILKTVLKDQLTSLLPVGKELIRRHIDRHLPNFTSAFDAPTTIFNQKISQQRKFVRHSCTKTAFEKIAKTHAVSTNDVVLAVCAGAIRRYLLEKNALPKRSLIGFVPISLRQDDSVTGNQLSFLLANLGTDLSCPKTRLNTIANSVKDSKARFFRLNQTQIINYSLAIYASTAVNLATGFMPKKQAFNLIISNIPGAKDELYLNGAKLTGIFPASVLLDGQALNITFANYQDKIDFGIIACQSALADIDRLADFIDQELDSLLSVI